MGFDYGKTFGATRTSWVKAYDTDSNKWLQSFSIDDVVFLLDEDAVRSYDRVAADGGLVCFVRHARAQEDYCVPSCSSLFSTR